ncbi:diguanylate cyclase [Marinomonas sp. UCMA 3892]|uniref:sensor domain-containing protein n=1 Tax=Marinomonas sp. UCMA 3892 TaxID=1972585 RepID=UPI00146F405E|nr:EAL domain-containing protein [Marinomonas sp. UCMA 3892]NLU99644.1 diguanylate cyclase [Marinomonas sp. UCMA 3892]
MTYPWGTILGYFLALCFLLIFIYVYIRIKVERNIFFQQLEHAENYKNQLTSSLDALSDPMWIKDKDQTYIYCNPAFEQFIGLSKLEIIGYKDEEIQSQHVQLSQNIIPAITSNEETGATEEYVCLPCGNVDYFQVSTERIYDISDQLFSSVGYAQKITPFKERESELVDAEIRVNEALKLTKVGIWEWNVSKDIWFATPSYFTMLGYAPVEGMADRKAELEKIHPEDRQHVMDSVNNILTSKSESNYYKYQARIRHIDGNYRWIGVRCIVTEFDQEDKPARMLGVRIDIDEIQKAHDQVEWLAHHDSLTKLPNRVALNKTFHKIIKPNTKIALLFIDLDHFKNVNDTLGHSIGDQLLLTVADRMRTLVNNIGYVARQGGDEFIILLPADNEECLIEKTCAIKEALSARYNIDQHQFFITPSIGVSLYPRNGEDFDSLYQRADAAMYHAKHTGRNRYAFFTEEMQAISTRALTLGNALHDAIERQEFSLHYQPQISLITGKIIGAEALIRWHSLELGHVSPGEFIPLAEENGQILAIGEWVLRETARQLKQWLEEGITPVRIAVNLSYAQFQVNDLPSIVEAILNEYAVPAQYLELELTERIATKDPEHTITILESFQQLGIHTSIDDFGTGYSSLSYLQRFPVYKLKIDQSFVRNMTTNTNDQVIVGTIILLAQQLGMTTIAEGVETKAQLEMLYNIGCDDIQGYYISRPIPAEEFKIGFLQKKQRFLVAQDEH